MLQIHSYILHNRKQVGPAKGLILIKINSWYNISELIEAEWLIHESVKLDQYNVK